MKSSQLLSAVAVAAIPLVQAQNYTQSGPFYLKLSSANSTLNGQYLGACHAGAAEEGLCLAGTETPGTYGQYFLNTTAESQTGILVWNLPLGSSSGGPTSLSSPMGFVYSPGTNVAVPLFTPGSTGQTYVGFNGSALYTASYLDDSTLVSGVYPTTSTVGQLENWYACWAEVGGYYYNALAWVTAGAPHNPTCQKVCVEMETS